MKIAPTGDLFDPIPWRNELNRGKACREFRGPCSPFPGMGCFGDLPGDGIVVSPPPQSLKHSTVRFLFEIKEQTRSGERPRFLEHYLEMHKALDGCMLAHVPTSLAQGLHRHGPW